MSVVVRRVEAGDREAWSRLYRGYAEFYEVLVPDLEVLWRWIGSGEMTCLVAEIDGRIVGLAHLREFVRPLLGVTAGFLDDLYVDPSARGRGVGRALLDAAAVLAHARGWSIVRWMTAESNVTAQALYDQVAGRVAGWLTNDMGPH